MGSPFYRRQLRTAVLPLFLFAATAAGQASDGDTPGTGVPEKRTVAVSARAAADYGRLPLVFVANAGQSDPRVRFLSRGPGYALFLTADEAVLKLNAGGADKGQADVIRMRLAGAQPPAAIVGEDIQGGTVNRFVGGTRPAGTAGSPRSGKSATGASIPGSTRSTTATRSSSRTTSSSAPASIPPSSACASRRADDPDRRQGDLVLSAAGGEIRQPKPFVYQMIAGERRAVTGRYVMKGKREVGFAIGAHNRALPLVIQSVRTKTRWSPACRAP